MELQDSFNKLCFQTFLNIIIDMSLVFGQILNAWDIMF
ncbi:hypothetical protein CLOLEP_02886 [[Clostridium] leptum DSM 753]|uniref:Uncharacterized protein n=1 Tax=[Clostridium] leptum DSM 753 TaxID=428125 RepID=A7VWC2_9FIRM|nr:hypothetical protein CLOLEP_02886 [[Clostridium] leptum DSM 753]